MESLYTHPTSGTNIDTSYLHLSVGQDYEQLLVALEYAEDFLLKSIRETKGRSFTNRETPIGIVNLSPEDLNHLRGLSHLNDPRELYRLDIKPCEWGGIELHLDIGIDKDHRLFIQYYCDADRNPMQKTISIQRDRSSLNQQTIERSTRCALGLRDLVMRAAQLISEHFRIETPIMQSCNAILVPHSLIQNISPELSDSERLVTKLLEKGFKVAKEASRWILHYNKDGTDFLVSVSYNPNSFNECTLPALKNNTRFPTLWSACISNERPLDYKKLNEITDNYDRILDDILGGVFEIRIKSQYDR